MRVAVLGGTSGMGRAIARRLAERGDAVCVLGREADALAATTADLALRSSSSPSDQSASTPPAAARCSSVLCDLEEPDRFAEALDRAESQLGGLDAVIVTAGLFAPQDALEADKAFFQRVANVNFVGTVLFCEHVKDRLLAKGGGDLVVLSSVAGDRGRKPVGLYGSTKAGLSHYLESLDYRYRGAGLRVLCVKPGFVKTAMTAGLKPPPFSGTAEQVARDVVSALDRHRSLLYTPRAWRWVMLGIRALPRGVMRRLAF